MKKSATFETLKQHIAEHGVPCKITFKEYVRMIANLEPGQHDIIYTSIEWNAQHDAYNHADESLLLDLLEKVTER